MTTTDQTSLADLVRNADAAGIAAFLDGLQPGDRAIAIRTLRGVTIQAKLWEIAASAAPVALADIVPVTTPPLTEVIYKGKNSLPAFSNFEKRFCRPPADGPASELWGYNEAPWRWATGPGYFVVHEEPGRGAAVDYQRVPPKGCPGWPDVGHNKRGLWPIVFGGLVDHLRRVAREVFIGRATRRGKDLNNYFVLSRA